ncbi:MAG TPA: hypothetical protein VK140_09975 [Ktedonobacteraceae bacterium]|nr:hypothetical protein [Ktedonobacteraceae bacterium]
MTKLQDDNYALIPHPTNREVLLLAVDDCWTLPRLEGRDELGPYEARDIQQAIWAQPGLEITVLDALHPRFENERKENHIVDALKALAVVNHDFTGQPEIVESNSSIFTAAVIIDALLSGKIAVAERPPYPQLCAHVIQQRLMCFREGRPTRLLFATLHMETPVGKLGDWVDAEAAAIVKELACVVKHILKIRRTIPTHAAPQHDVVAACNDIQGVHLHGLDGAQCLGSTLLALPTSSRPQSLPSKYKASRSSF